MRRGQDRAWRVSDRGMLVSIAIDILDKMIAETAEIANKVAITDEAYDSFDRLGMGIGVGIRLSILLEARNKILKAEMKQSEIKRDSLPGWWTG